MSDFITHPLFGAKGGGGGSFRQTPDNLRSQDTFEGLMGVSIGPIKGPTNGLKSVKFDGTPVENETGDSNFPGFVTVVSSGNPVNFPEKPVLRLGAAAAPLAVNAGLINPPNGSSVFVTRTVNNVAPDYLDFRFIVNQLYKQDKSGIYNETLTLEIQLKPTGKTTWINPTIGLNNGSTGNVGSDPYKSPSYQVLYNSGDAAAQNTAAPNYSITGKTTGPAVFEVRIWVPSEGEYANVTWDVRARLVEKESESNNDVQVERKISWESIAAVYNEELGEEEEWRGVSWLQFYGVASDQLSGVPEVEMETDAKIVSVPSSAIYNPETRVYNTGIWDGSWAKGWTNDPAWVINDAISDELSGIALLAPGSHLNKWDALEASKWFSEMVPDGNGGTHPRYSMNVVSGSPMKAEDFIRYLAGAVGAFAWDEGNGEWRIKVDKPDEPVDIFTLDTIEGEFIYSHSDVDTRYNDYTGTFLNAEMDYREDSVHIYDNESIAKIGHKPTNIALVGCTNRQEAMRRLMIRLRSSVNETKLVTFVTNRRGRNIEQLNTILIADGHLGEQSKRTYGRTIAVAADRLSITLRDPVRLELNTAYKLKFSSLNPTYSPTASTQPSSPDWGKPTKVSERGITNSAAQRGAVTTLYLDAPLPANIPDNLSIALEAPDLPAIPKLYRVTNVVYDDDGERVSISALEVDTGKWYASDNVSNINTVFQNLRGAVPSPLPPPGGDVLRVFRSQAEQGSNSTLIATWQRPPGAYVAGFKVTYSVNGGPEQLLTEFTGLNSAELSNPPAGIYEFSIYTVSRDRKVSVPLRDFQVVDPNNIAAEQIYYAGGVSLEDLRPATAGATKNNPRGEWASGVAYDAGDVVSFAGRSYLVTLGHTSSGTVPDLTKMMLLADKGSAGLSVATVYIYQRADAAPATPSANTTFNFANTTLTGLNNGWTTGIPANNGKPLWVSVASAVASSETDVIVPSDWTPSQTLASDGGAGLNVATVFLYQRSDVLPSLPSSPVTYTFQSGVVSGLTNGWSQTIPGGTNPIYVSTATAASTASSDTIPTSEWTAPVILARNGADGFNAISGVLTNESHTVATDKDGNYGDLSQAGGKFRVFNGIAEVTGNASVTYSWLNVTPGLSISVAGDGTYTISGFTVDQATATLRAIYGGVTVDRIYSITKAKAGQPGVNAISGILTNESHTVTTANDGSGGDYSTAGGTFKVFNGTGEVTGGAVNYSIPSVSSGLSISINASGIYTVTGLTVDQATATIRATYAGVAIDRVYSISKSKTGLASKLVKLSSNKQVQPLAANGGLLENGDFVVTASRQNISSPVTWSWEYGHGFEIGTTAAGDTFTVTAIRLQSIFNVNIANYNDPTAKLTASVTENGVTYYDTISFIQVKDGAAGASGADAINAVTGALTNEAHTVSTAPDGSGGNYSDAGGVFRVFSGTKEITGAAVVYSWFNTTPGLSFTVAGDGSYTISGLNVDTATTTLRAVYNPHPYTLGLNTVANSDFANVSGETPVGFRNGWNGNVPNVSVPNRGINLPGYYGNGRNIPYVTFGGPSGSGNYAVDGWESIANTEVNNQLNVMRWGMPVNEGDRMFFSAMVANHRCWSQVLCVYYDANGAYINESSSAYYNASPGGGEGGNLANFTRIAGFGEAPAGAKFASVRARLITNGGDSPFLFYTQLMLTRVPAGSNVWPDYTPSPAVAVAIDRVYSISKSKSGAVAKSVSVSANKQVQPLDAAGGLLDNGDFIVTASRQNLSAVTVWAWEYGHGQEPETTTVSGDTFTVKAARVRELINYNRANMGNPTARLFATVTENGVSYTDSISFIQVQNGSNAKTVTLTSDRQTIAYNSAGAPTPASQTTVFTAFKQNTTAGVTWSIADANGVTQPGWLTNYSDSGNAASVALTEANFNGARNGTSGVIVTASIYDGTAFSDRVSVVRVQDGSAGSPGSPGQNATVAAVAPETHVVLANADGSAKSGQFPKQSQISVTSGITDATSSASYSGANFVNCTGSVSASGVITFTGMTNAANTATCQVTVSFGGFSTIVKVTLNKSRDLISTGTYTMTQSNGGGVNQPIAVTNGVLTVNGTLTVEKGGGTNGIGTLVLLNGSGAQVKVLSTLTTSSSGGLNIGSTYTITGLQPGEFQTWYLRLVCDATGAGGSASATAEGGYLLQVT